MGDCIVAQAGGYERGSIGTRFPVLPHTLMRGRERIGGGNIPKITQPTNLVLIGMPGVGKSTVGILLAKATSRDFLDTDVYIQAQEGRSLQEIIDREGTEAFCRLEERHVLSLICRSCVIATGGSVVYHSAAMGHLGSSGVIIHLNLDLPALERRLTNLDSRGVVMAPGQTLSQLFAERQPLYRKYAHHTIPCANRTHEEIVDEIARRLGIDGRRK